MNDLEKHFEAVDACKNILFNANTERQETHARQLLEAVTGVEKHIFIGGGK